MQYDEVIVKDLYRMLQHLIIVLMLHALSDLYRAHSNFLQSFQVHQQHLLLFFPLNLLTVLLTEVHMVSSVHRERHYGTQHFQQQNKQIYEYYDQNPYSTQ